MTRHCLWFLISCMALWGSLANPRVANAQSDLAKAAQAVLKNRCFSCHGEGGANEGGFNYALNRKRLAREMIIPGDAEESKLFQRVAKGEMPPDGDKLPPEEIETLKQWIEADAPAFSVESNRAFVSPTDMLVAMSKDLEKANERDRQFYRYFTLTHLYNAGFDDNELESYRQGLSKLANSLSWGREVVPPLPIDADKTILRIDLRKYKWNENDAWSQIIAADPYHVTYTDAMAEDCYAMTQCDLPHVRADWFVFAASRPPLYNVILGLPDSPEQMLKFEKERLGVDVARNLQDYNDVLRAGFNGSGVSKNVRLIERHVSSYGAYWKSYDFKPNDPKDQPPKRRSLKATPTGPGGPNGFEHDGGEMIFNLPNGLQGYMLTDAKGQQIEKGPTDVVVDKEAVKRGRDPEVVNGVSCMNCHWSGMLNKSDQIRDHVLSQPANFSATVVEFVTAVYAKKTDLDAKLKEDRGRFEAAVLKCGLSGLAMSEPVATLAFHFDEPLDINLAAAEASVSIEKFTAALKSNPALGRELNSLPQGQPVPRDQFVPLFGALIKELRVGVYHSPVNGGHQPPDPMPDPLIGTKAGELREFTLPGGVKLKQVWCPPGTFTMGSPASEKDRDDIGEDQIEVTLTKGFWLAQTEITQSQWTAVMGASSKPWSGKRFVKEGPNYPASYVNHGVNADGTIEADSAIAFCEKLTEIERPAGRLPTGWKYALPTEAQWEYACRAGAKTAYSFGDEESQLKYYANFMRNANGIGEYHAQAVGMNKPNTWGLSDMHGNVWEWCRDAYDIHLPGGSDPLVVSADEADRVYRVYRGGSWFSASEDCRSARRNRPLLPYRREYDLGFRLATVPVEPD